MDQSCQLEGEDLTGKGRLREPSHEIFPDGKLKKKKHVAQGGVLKCNEVVLLRCLKCSCFLGWLNHTP